MRNFYSRKNYEWVSEKKERLKKGNKEDPFDFFENFIDFSLGVDFPKEKRSSIIENRKSLEKSIKSLYKLLEDGKITKEDYISSLSFESQRSFEKTSWVLTDEEFEKLFQFKKEKIPNVFRSLSALSDY
ncbi:MAG: hypothetical protein WC349_02935 [Patescibacteria group bacterium]|jgi:hypothetical protein